MSPLQFILEQVLSAQQPQPPQPDPATAIRGGFTLLPQGPDPHPAMPFRPPMQPVNEPPIARIAREGRRE